MLGRRTALVTGALVLLVAGLALGACGGGEAKPATQARTLTPPSATVTTPTVPTTPIDPVPTATTPIVPKPTTPTTPTTTPPAPTSTATSTPTTPNPTATSTPTTPNPTATSSCGSVAGGFISDIRGVSAGCAEARATGRAWLRAVQASGRPQGPLVANGLSCRGRLRGERASVGCTGPDGRTRVTFSASP